MSTATFRVEKTKNFSVMSNYHLTTDQDLSLKAKGLLSVMLSLPPNWDYSLQGLMTLFHSDGKASITAGLKELEDRHYLIRRRTRREGGRFGDIQYIIYEQPYDVMQNAVTSDVPKSDFRNAEKPELDSPKLDFPDAVNPEHEKQPQINTNNQNTNKINTKSFLPHSVVASKRHEQQSEDLKKTDEDRRNDALQEYQRIIEGIKQNVGYTALVNRERIREKRLADQSLSTTEIEQYQENAVNMQDIDLIIRAMADVIIGDKSIPVKIGQEKIDRSIVIDHLELIGFNEIREAEKRLRGGGIKNKKAYAISILYNL